MATEISRILKITVGLILFIKQIKRNLLGIFDIYLLRLTRFNSIWLKKNEIKETLKWLSGLVCSRSA